MVIDSKYDMRAIIYLVFLSILFFFGCQQQEKSLSPKEKTEQGLIGAYYGDADLTNIKYPEILHSLSNKYDESTGHGGTWSGKYVGFIKSPVSRAVTFELTTNQTAAFKIADKQQIKSSEGKPAILTIQLEKNNVYPVEIVYLHQKNKPSSVEVSWLWKDKPKEMVPDSVLFFNDELAEKWNYIIESSPQDIDYSKFTVPEKEDVIVYYEKGRFAGWPANNGIIWRWANEMVVGFSLGYYKENPLHHSIDEEKGSDRVLARSLDGGESWQFEGEIKRLPKKSEIVNYGHPNFAMYVDDDEFWVSYDKAKTWEGPYEIPHFDWEKLTSRTDYIVEGDSECIYFLSVEDKNVQARLEDRTFCARTTDGGRTFEFLSWIGKPDTHRAVMPSSVKLSDSHIITSLRRRFDGSFEDTKPKLSKNWIDVYESLDNGKTWGFLSKVAETDMGKNNGNPPSLVELNDGRLVLTYGYRAVPYGIRAKVSSDGGKTWSKEIHLRDYAREYDMGYTRSAVRPDGKVVTVYYFTSKEKKEQHIAATIWNPDIKFK